MADVLVTPDDREWFAPNSERASILCTYIACPFNTFNIELRLRELLP